MNFNFERFSFQRLAMHKIIAKKDHNETATCEFENSLIQVTDEVTGLLKTRLTDAAGKKSRAFELKISNSTEGSFFDLCESVKDKDDDEFYNTSKEIAQLAARSQTRKNYPGGYLVIIQATSNTSNTNMFIVIKAELHEALRPTSDANSTKLEMLKNIFLSPSQKLYKIGALYESNNQTDSDNINDNYGCFIFDDQFSGSRKPAEYFFKDFLGFDTSSNSKILTSRFYNETKNFIVENFDDYDTQNRLISSLKREFDTNLQQLFHIKSFSENYFEEDEVRLKFNRDIAAHYPGSFLKDNTLLGRELKTKKILFAHNIRIQGPEETVNDNVTVISNKDDIEDVDLKSDTLVLFKGRPFSNE